jgi:hypothetical protein
VARRLVWHVPLQRRSARAGPKSEEAAEAKEAATLKVEQAITILEMLLAKFNGKLEVSVAKRELTNADISRATYGRALQKLKLKTHYEVDAKGERRYYWSAEAA